MFLAFLTCVSRGRGSSEAQATRGQPSKVTTRSTRSTLRVDDTLGFPVGMAAKNSLVPLLFMR